MNVRDYEKSLKQPLRQATVMLLLRDGEILLAMKKRGFGTGKWNGVGGKQNPGEEILATAIRETEEEIGVTPINPKKVAIFNYLFPHKPDWGQRVHIFTTTKWRGVPAETEEMKPEWFKLKDIPYEQMWSDDIVWLPEVLSGKIIKGSFMFGEDEKIVDYYIDEVTKLS